MADVFISYKSERRSAARYLAKILAAHGYDVWYDYGLIPGDDFEPRLMSELAEAKAVTVFWCKMAVESKWVNKEAGVSRLQGKYLPCWIENAELPKGFADADTISLVEWDGAPRSHLLDRLVEDVARRVGRDPINDYKRLRQIDEDWRGYGAPSLTKFAIGRNLMPEREESLERRQPPGPWTPLAKPPVGISGSLASGNNPVKSCESRCSRNFGHSSAEAIDPGQGGLQRR
jgi:hypothetical protein